MSALYFAAVFHHGPRKPNERLVLMAMAEAADHDSGEVHMKCETIADRAGVSKATAWRCIAALKAGDDPWISEHTPGTRRNGAQGASWFVLNVDRLRELVGEKRRSVRVSQDETGVSGCDTRRLNLRHLGPSQDETPHITIVSKPAREHARTAYRRSPPEGGGGTPVDEASLSPFQRTCVRSGTPVVIGERVLKADSDEMRALRQAVILADRSSRAESGCV